MTEPTTFDGAPLAADLESEDPARVRRALEALDHAWKQGRFAALAAPSPVCLDAFGADVPQAVIRTYLSVIENYPAFSPGLSPGELHRHLLEAVIRHGGGDAQLAHAVALHLRTTFQPAAAARDALDWLASCGLDEQATAKTARALVDALLDDAATRAATVAAMRWWATLDELGDVIEGARPRLDEAERAQLVVDDE